MRAKHRQGVSHNAHKERERSKEKEIHNDEHFNYTP
jgi:hypothetical protein